MGEPLRALLIDDSPDDTELLVRHLRRNGFEVQWERVDSPDALRAALANEWDVACCDYTMPLMKGPEALAILRASAPDLPVIVVSGQVGEEYAVDVMRAGAADYVRKDNLVRLVPAIRRELVGSALREREQRVESLLELAAEAASIGLWEYDHDGFRLSREWKANLGYAPDAVADRIEAIDRLAHPDERGRFTATLRNDLAAGAPHSRRIEMRLLHQDGEYRWMLAGYRVRIDRAGYRRVLGFHIDISERKQAEEALARANTFLEEAQELGRFGSWEYLADTQRTVWSDGECRIYGIDPREGSPNYADMLARHIHPDDAALVDTSFREAVESATIFELEHRIIRPDGSERVVFDRAQPHFDAQGRLLKYTGATLDITDRKATEASLRASERRFRMMAEALPHIVWLSAPDGAVEYLNRQFVEYTGVPEAGQLGSGGIPAVHPDDQTRTMTAWQQAIAAGSAYRRETRLRRADGVYRWFLSQAVPLRDSAGNIVQWLGSCTDIDEMKALEAQIIQLNATLAQRVEDRTAELQAAVTELEAFNFSVSHDLHGPLRQIEGFAQALVEDYGAQLPEAARRYLDRIRSGTERMARMLDALLRLSRAGRAELQVQRIDLAALATAAFMDFRRAEGDRSVEFTVGQLPETVGDAPLLQQALGNLIGNALKFTRPAKDARIEVGCERRDGEDVFFVRDNGVGFDSARAGALFGVFKRFHAEADFEGSGVGLSITRRIVERHGGRIWAESAPGHGATFRFTLRPSATNGRAAP